MEISLEALANTFTAPEQVKESTAFRTVRTGLYRLQAVKATPEVDDSPEARVPGRERVNVQNTAYSVLTGERAGTIFYRASWEEHRREDRNGELKLDFEARLWGQLVKALGMEQSSVLDTLQALAQYPLIGYITEPFKAADGTYVNYKTDDERKALVEQGLEPTNFVQNLSRVKA